MKTLISMLALSVAAMVGVSAHADTAQQSKMTTCNKEATGKTGADRKTFMSDCLKGGTAAAPAAMPASPAKMTQQERMKTCAAESKGKKGDEHKAFMKECLSKK